MTCVVPSFNSERALLRETVMSALDAGVNEVVIADDGSTEPVTFARGRVRIVRLPENRGCSAALNAGIAAARYPWIIRLDVGDAVLPAKLAQVAATVLAGELASFSQHVNGLTRQVVFPAVEWADRLATDNQFAASTTVFHRRAWERAGRYDESLRYSDDWDFAVRVEATSGWTYYPEVTAIATQWPGGTSDVVDPEKLRRKVADRALVSRRSRNLDRQREAQS